MVYSEGKGIAGIFSYSKTSLNLGICSNGYFMLFSHSFPETCLGLEVLGCRFSFYRILFHTGLALNFPFSINQDCSGKKQNIPLPRVAFLVSESLICLETLKNMIR